MAAAKGNGYARKYTDQQIQDIYETITDWALNSNEIYISTMLWKKYGKTKNWLHDLAKTYPLIKQGIEEIKALIAAKISNHCFEGDKNVTFGMRILPMYCSEYKALKEWEALLSKNEGESKTSFEELLKAFQSGSLLEKLSQSKCEGDNDNKL